MTYSEKVLMKIEMYLMKKYGCDEAHRLIDPLSWYINTGRASMGFIRGVDATKPHLIARILKRSGSAQDIVDALKAYVKEA